jgi:transcriptional regulator with AAA-type ATPase domain
MASGRCRLEQAGGAAAADAGSEVRHARHARVSFAAVGDTRTLNASEEELAELEPALAAYLVIALDCARPLEPAVRLHLDAARVSIGRGSRRAWKRSPTPGGKLDLRVDLEDAWLSSSHASLRPDETAPGGWLLEDTASKNGTLVNGTRVQRAALEDGDVIEVGSTLLVFRVVKHAGRPGDHAMLDGAPQNVPRTLNAAWASSLATLLRLARSSVPVLLLGATGTGKEVLARAVHAASGRAGPFVAVNCGAVARTLIESELFGARKGSFSGATEDRPGLVRAADRGTLFLDEIAELPEPSQVALLRVLQEQEVLPVGETRPVQVDVRVVAATHADLAARVADGRFRGDLYARLSGHVVRVPPLRARIEDVGLLVGELLARLAPDRAGRLVLSRSAARALFAHAWPFNVRELEHALQAALAIIDDDEIGLAHLPEAVRAGRASSIPAASHGDEPDDVVAERARIVAALEACNGNQTHAARMLGVSRATLVTKIAIHRLPRPRKRGP